LAFPEGKDREEEASGDIKSSKVMRWCGGSLLVGDKDMESAKVGSRQRTVMVWTAEREERRGSCQNVVSKKMEEDE